MLAQSASSTMLSALTPLFNSGTLNIYSGTQPATPETTVASGNTILATFSYAATAYSAPAYDATLVINGTTYTSMTAVASFVEGSVLPVAEGVATFGRAFESGGSTVIGDFTVGTAATDIILGNTTIQTGVTLTVSSILGTSAL